MEAQAHRQRQDSDEDRSAHVHCRPPGCGFSRIRTRSGRSWPVPARGAAYPRRIVGDAGAAARTNRPATHIVGRVEAGPSAQGVDDDDSGPSSGPSRPDRRAPAASSRRWRSGPLPLPRRGPGAAGGAGRRAAPARRHALRRRPLRRLLLAAAEDRSRGARVPRGGERLRGRRSSRPSRRCARRCTARCSGASSRPTSPSRTARAASTTTRGPRRGSSTPSTAARPAAWRPPRRCCSTSTSSRRARRSWASAPSR